MWALRGRWRRRGWVWPVVWLAALVQAAFAVAAPVAGAATHHYAVGEIVVAYTDHSRLIYPPRGGPRPRALVTVILYPALGDPAALDVRGARPAKRSGPFPLVVFAHGFNITPYPYLQLLNAWASAGYVVAAPIFPLTNPNAPGGPDEADLVNQPGDVSFVITRMLSGDRKPSGILSGLLDRREVAVTGQSDGGSTALATAYAVPLRDPRLAAAMILSGARIPGVGGYFAAGGPPLLAVQGTADTSNSPSATYRYYALAPGPKFLLQLWGAPHLGPYTDEEPYLGVVERVSIAFLDRYLKHRRGARARMSAAGDVPGLAMLSSGT